jgi:hypothetical protein
MVWSYRSYTTAVSKLLEKWKVEGTNMAYDVAYFASL